MPWDLLGVLFTVSFGFLVGWVLCSRTQRNRLDASVAIARVANDSSANVITAASSVAHLGPTVERLSRTMDSQAEAYDRLKLAIDALDQGQGAILNALHHAGVLEGTTARSRTRYRGQPDADNEPPPLDAQRAGYTDASHVIR